MIKVDEILDVAAPCIPVQVVSVKWPRNWIVRGIFCFRTPESVIALIRPFVAFAPQDELEWSQHEYRLPHYLAYGEGDLPRIGWPGQGVFLWRYSGAECYRDGAWRLDESQ